MRILVDADACPVKNIIKKIARLYGVEVIFFIDNAHILKEEEYEIINVSIGIDSVDLKILSFLKTDDIVVTQDFGLASLVLAKGARSLNQNGLEYTNNNIEMLLFERYASKENRKIGKHKNMKKRDSKLDLKFETKLLEMIK